MPDTPPTPPIRVKLSAASARGLARLVSDVTGGPALAGFPYLAPALLLADPQVKRRLRLPGGPDLILVQEYQSIIYDSAVPVDTGLTAKASVALSEKSADYSFALSEDDAAPCARLNTVLRLMTVGDMIAGKPVPFRKAVPGVRWSSAITIVQDDVNAYLALSGDDNPIHLPPARQGQLDRAIVPGLLLGSLIQPHCEAATPDKGLSSLKIRFMAPLFAGEAVRIGVQPRGDSPENGVTRLRAYVLGRDDRALALADLVLSRVRALT